MPAGREEISPQNHRQIIKFYSTFPFLERCYFGFDSFYTSVSRVRILFHPDIVLFRIFGHSGFGSSRFLVVRKCGRPDLFSDFGLPDLGIKVMK